MEQNDSLDLLKYILSLMIIAIHASLFSTILHPWLRIAVPMFFMTSSYLYFSKYLTIENKKEKNSILKKYVSRNLIYYIFWFIVLLPTTINERKSWYTGSILLLVKKIISQTLFSSTFIASWFIVASIEAIFILSKVNIKKVFMSIIVIFIYIICCLRSSYNYVFGKDNFITNFINHYEDIFCCPIFSFPIALFWMFLGKLFAEYKELHEHIKLSILGIVIFSICLFIEFKMVYKINGTFRNDLYFMLAPLCFCLFSLVLNCNIKIPKAKTLRNISIISYPLHASLVPNVIHFLCKINLNKSVLTFIIVVILCHLITFAILKLEKVKIFSFLKYSH